LPNLSSPEKEGAKPPKKQAKWQMALCLSWNGPKERKKKEKKGGKGRTQKKSGGESKGEINVVTLTKKEEDYGFLGQFELDLWCKDRSRGKHEGRARGIKGAIRIWDLPLKRDQGKGLGHVKIRAGLFELWREGGCHMGRGEKGIPNTAGSEGR